jgi:hypothetical protein
MTVAGNLVYRALETHLKTEHQTKLLELVPGVGRLKWLSNTQEIVRGSLQRALYIGNLHGSKVLAILVRPPHRSLLANRYGLESPDGTVKLIPYDDVSNDCLDEPFCHIHGASDSEKNKLGLFIKFLFAHASFDVEISGVMPDICKRLHACLRTVANATRSSPLQGGEEAEHNSGDKARRVDIRGMLADNRSPGLYNKNRQNPDLNAILDFLKQRDAVGLHFFLPDAMNMTFGRQTYFDEDKAQPKKLLVGFTKDDRESIWVYLHHYSPKYHSVAFIKEGKGRAEKLSAEQLALQNLLFPFNKLISSSGVDQDAKARLMVMVKWYFIQGEVTIDVILKETKDFPHRFHKCLEYLKPLVEAEKFGNDPAPSTSRNGALDFTPAQHHPTRSPTLTQPAVSTSKNGNVAEANGAKSANSRSGILAPSSSSSTMRGTKRKSIDPIKRAKLFEMLQAEEKLTVKINELEAGIEDLDKEEEYFVQKQIREREAFMKTLMEKQVIELTNFKRERQDRREEMQRKKQKLDDDRSVFLTESGKDYEEYSRQFF